MRRLMEMDVADSVRARVIAGPADLMTWEVSACIDDSKGMTLAVIGRGVDLEAAAASALAVLTENGSTLRRPMGQLDPPTPDPEIQDSEQSMHPPGCPRHLPAPALLARVEPRRLGRGGRSGLSRRGRSRAWPSVALGPRCRILSSSTASLACCRAVRAFRLLKIPWLVAKASVS